MPLRSELRKVMVIGSGPIVIGQAAEFDYAGTQACQALRELGLEVILANSNPATIMTDPQAADRVYIEPLTPEVMARIIERERPQGLLPTLGGQVGLNLAVSLARSGVLERYGVRLLGTPLEAIVRAEDREQFKATMLAIGQPVPDSVVVRSVAEALSFAERAGYPVIVRPAYTLGGTGGGIATDPGQLETIAGRGLKLSLIGQVLVEKSVAGWKEIEYEVLRDGAGNCITICNMENVDPVGIHTGDSIVVAPSQTLTDREYHALRTASLNIIRTLGIEGGCNVQYALDPASGKYAVIEVNPRVSRSSALASKATGYPIARMAAMIACGLRLDEIRNPVTGTTSAFFEPALDYVVVKIPRWPFDKFAAADRTLGTQMKSTGEVMALGRTFEEALLKAVRSLETGQAGLRLAGLDGVDDADLAGRLRQADDRRLYAVAEAFRRGWAVGWVGELTGIDPFFLHKIAGIVSLEEHLKEWAPGNGVPAALPADLLRRAKATGLADAEIASLTGFGEDAIREWRRDAGIVPTYKVVDTCAAEFEACTPYFYSTYEREDEADDLAGDAILVIGSGPIRIGQGIEFDYCSVHAVRALREAGCRSLIINCNPETVSTDFNTSDRLYFEPLLLEDVLNVVGRQRPRGVIVQFGGQTAVNLAVPLARAGVPVLGTPVESIDVAENRDRFDRLLAQLDIPRPPGATARSPGDAVAAARRTGYPVLVRPSYVLGGRAMEIVYGEDELEEYMAAAALASPGHPVLIDRYIPGREVEVDAVADGETVLIPGIMEHVERAGVHSGDSIAVFPPQGLTSAARARIVDYTTRLALALEVRGLINIQFVVDGDEVWVLEVNPRASRTVPFLTKVTGVPMVRLATGAILGRPLAAAGWPGGLLPDPGHVAVKMPVFSWSKLTRVETSLGPEMKSTGEVMGIDTDYAAALYKAFLAAGYALPERGAILATVADKDKGEAIPLLQFFRWLGYDIHATAGTATAMERAGVRVKRVHKIGQGSPDILDLIRTGTVNLVVNTLTRGKAPERDGFKIRRAAVEYSIPCLTSLDTVRAIAHVLAARRGGREPEVRFLAEYVREAGPGGRYLEGAV